MKLGQLTIDPVEYGSQGNAVLGIRDSGKTYSATFFAEQLFDAGIPFITFDPIGVWRFLRVPGNRRGYPIVVAGGKEGDLPLTVSGAPEIVRAAMVGGVSLVIDLFDIRLSKADWRRIVTAAVRVLLHENQAHGLRHVFLEEAAEFIPQKPTDWDVYAEIEKLARMGGNARLGYTLINQRSQEVSKAILELCENVFLHRQRGKNALENMDKWLAIAGAEQQRAIIKSLPELPQGQCWAWLGGDRPQPPTLVKVPAKNSFHPDRRVMRGDRIAGAKPPIDVSAFVTGMKGSLSKIEEEAKANDPNALRSEIAALKAERDKLAKATPVVDHAALTHAEGRGFARGYKAGVENARQSAKVMLEAASRGFDETLQELSANAVVPPEPVRRVVPSAPPTVSYAKLAATPLVADGTFSRPQMRVLQALTMWRALGHEAPSREMVAAVAGYSPSSGGFNTLLGSLGTLGAVEKPQPGRLSLTAAGIPEMSADDGRQLLWSTLSNPQRKIVAALNDVGTRTREELGEATGYSASSGGFNTLVGSLNTLGITCRPQQGSIALSDWAQELLTGHALSVDAR